MEEESLPIILILWLKMGREQRDCSRIVEEEGMHIQRFLIYYLFYNSE